MINNDEGFSRMLTTVLGQCATLCVDIILVQTNQMILLTKIQLHMYCDKNMHITRRNNSYQLQAYYPKLIKKVSFLVKTC